jgi:predicted Rossmann fold flavoprotein
MYIKFMKNFDVIIIGGGASGLMAAITAGKRGKTVCVLDHAKSLGTKILISGGGRCNFTNLDIAPEKYISKNKHFMKSAFSQYTQYDFINLVKKHNIAYHEKTLGQLFCDDSAQQILTMLLDECKLANVQIITKCEVDTINKIDDAYSLQTSKGNFKSSKLVMACGGLSIPKAGATNFGFKIASQFNLSIEETAPALVPFTFSEKDKEIFADLSGIACEASATIGKTTFKENILFTHRGISGPAILQISSYWNAGDSVKICLLPNLDWLELLETRQKTTPKQELKTVLYEILQKRFVNALIEHNLIKNLPLNQLNSKDIAKIVEFFDNFSIKPNGTEGYRKAEVTKGGISTKELDSKTLECKNIAGLYFIGELVDVTGWLGGYNFQWAWSSGFACGSAV